LMGEYVNTRLFNVVAWTTTVLVVGLSLMWAWSSMKG
jgi:Mn2+/Fe2+ NRAMP family transporter